MGDNKNLRQVLVAALFSLLTMPGLAADLIPITPAQQQSLGIAVAPVSPFSAMSGTRMPGEIMVPVGQERVVSVAQPGLIDAVYAAAGQNVKKGQALAHLSSPELVALQRDYLQAMTQQRLAKNTLDRDEELFKDGIIAERRYLASKSSYEELVALLASRRQALRLAGMGEGSISQLESKGELSSGLTVSAPMAGMVLEQMVTAGQRVDSAMPLFRIGRLHPLWLEIHAPLESMGSVSQGMKVRIPQYQAEGKIITVIRSVNKDDQTVHIRAEITLNAERLSPGQFVEAEVETEGAPGKHFSVPKGAVVRNGADSYVFVQSAKGFIPLKVTVVSEQSDRTVIAGNLAGNEKIAASGVVTIKAAWVGTGSE